MSDKQAEHQSTRFTILPHQRIPIPMRLRFAAECLMASRAVPKDASPMRQRRCFRLAMEKQKRRMLRLWRGAVR
jgi:hypothetical protein